MKATKKGMAMGGVASTKPKKSLLSGAMAKGGVVKKGMAMGGSPLAINNNGRASAGINLAYGEKKPAAGMAKGGMAKKGKC